MTLLMIVSIKKHYKKLVNKNCVNDRANRMSSILKSKDELNNANME